MLGWRDILDNAPKSWSKSRQQQLHKVSFASDCFLQRGFLTFSTQTDGIIPHLSEFNCSRTSKTSVAPKFWWQSNLFCSPWRLSDARGWLVSRNPSCPWCRSSVYEPPCWERPFVLKKLLNCHSTTCYLIWILNCWRLSGEKSVRNM